MNTLHGRVAVVAGDGPEVVPVCQRLLAAGVSLAVVGPDRAVVQAAVADVSDPSLIVVPMTADPGDPAVWVRLVPHAEQRLGPIDLAIAIGPRSVRDLAHDHLVADMRRRGHGVFVESDHTVETREVAAPVSYRSVPRDQPDLVVEIIRLAGA